MGLQDSDTLANLFSAHVLSFPDSYAHFLCQYTCSSYNTQHVPTTGPLQLLFFVFWVFFGLECSFHMAYFFISFLTSSEELSLTPLRRQDLYMPLPSFIFLYNS